MNILDTPPEAYLDRITEFAAQVFGVPIALISLVDQKRQWFKARHGLQARETPRDVSFCSHAILERAILCVPDTQLDPRFSDNPLVTGAPHIRFYAGRPLCATGGEALGTLCLIDSRPRDFSGADRKLLDALAQCVEQVFAMREKVTATASGKGSWTGVLITALTAGLFELLSPATAQILASPAILIATVVYAAFHGGMRAGLISAAIAWLSLAHVFSIPGQLFVYATDDFLRMLGWAVATPAIAVMTGFLQRRSAHLFLVEEANAILTTRLAERAAAFGEMYELNQQIRVIVESAPTNIAYYGQDMRCRFSNAIHARWFGRTADQITGMHVREIVGDAGFAEVEPYLRRVLAGEKVHYQRSQTRADGRIHTVEELLTPHIEPDGKIDGWYCFFNDISERKHAEEVVLRSERLKAATLAAALDAIISLDHEGNVIEFNPAAERCFGYARDEVIGKPMVDLLIPLPLRARHREGFKRYLETGESRVLGQRMILPALRADCTQIEIELAIMRLPGADPPVLTAFARDVTEVKRAEEAARRSQERLERALEGSRTALFEFEVASGRVYLSESWAEMIGTDPGETQTTVAELMESVHPDEREVLWNHAMDTISGKSEGYDVEHRVRRPDGQWIWIISRCRAVERDASGRTVRMAGTNVDITERKHTEQRLHYLATRDALTDLTNRALFGDSLEKAVDEASQQSGRVALISIGLDRFTTINDSLGQHVGDLVLKCVADRLSATVGSEITVARPGGDEFLVLMPRIQSAHEAASIAENIRAAITAPIRVERRELVVTASIGIALYPDDGDSAGFLLRNADIALHNAKDAGRDNLRFFANRMNVDARIRLETEAALRQALERDEFVVHYQPQIELATGALIGFEALVRWQHPERGLVLPGDFLSIAESTGLIVALGERVLIKACRQAALWQWVASAPVRVAVNVTARQFRQKGFVNAVKGALTSSGLDPRLLELEIIENAIMEHGPETIATLDAICSLGVNLAIDDFGTGYSSLSYLKRLPIDTVKIDRSFVADLPDDPDAGAIVCAIIALGHNLGIKVLAEGVETSAQLTYLRDHGCDRAQGYFFGRPQPAELISVADGGNLVLLKRTGSG